MASTSISPDDIFKAVMDAAGQISPKYSMMKNVTLETRFDELGIDSFGIMSLLVSVEAQLGIDLTRLSHMDMKIMSIQDVVNLVQSITGP